MTALRKLSVASVTFGMALALSVGSASASDSAPERVLQSVQIGMGTDASIEQVNDIRVSVSDSSESLTSVNTFVPTEVSQDLPVRVLTSYRTDEGIGTDLADLAGYSGAVTIDISVQNLTLQPTDVSYDVAGQRHTRQELVGTPLTVVGATTVDVAPSDVIVSSKNQTYTNGVISMAEEGGTNVQWATIMAPPTLPASTVFTLVAEVEDFEVPSFELVVQPGYVSDASVSGLLSTSFGASDTEADLIRETIVLMADLDELLGETGTVISEARSELEHSAQTVGTRTVNDLQQSIVGIEASTANLVSTLNSLQARVDTGLRSSSSAVLSQLSSTTAAMSALLGDPSTTQPTLEVIETGSVCSVEFKPSEGNYTVSGSLLNVSALLNAYGNASQLCQAEIQKKLDDVLGPVDPAADDNCEGADSVTCRLYQSKQEYDSALVGLEQKAGEAVAALEGDLIDEAVTTAGSVKAGTDRVEKLLVALEEGSDPDGNQSVTAAVGNKLVVARQEIDNARDELDAISDKLDGINREAVRGIDRVEQQEEIAADLKEQICVLGPEYEVGGQLVLTAGALDQRQINDLLRVVSETSCSGGRLPGAWRVDSMEEMNAKERAAWESLADQTSKPADGAGADEHELVRASLDQLDELEALLGEIEGIVQGDSADLEASVDSIRAEFDEVSKNVETLVKQVDDIDKNYDDVQNDVSDVFDSTRETVGQDIDAVFGESIDSVSGLSGEASNEIGSMFRQLSEELKATSSSIATEGTETVNRTQQDLAASYEGVAAEVGQELEAGLNAVQTTVEAGVVDLEATNALLAADIQRVLNDIGVGTVDGGGLLGTIASSAASTGLADTQLAVASESATGFANVQRENLADSHMRSAVSRASVSRLSNMSPYAVNANPNVEYTTVYAYTIGKEK